jgi:hypothetical protein
VRRLLYFVWLRWLWILEPPWQHSGPVDARVQHRVAWYAGWAWTLAWLVYGAINAPSLLEAAGISPTQYQAWQSVGVAVVLGLLGMTLGWIVVTVVDLLHAFTDMAEELRELRTAWHDYGVPPFAVLFIVPLFVIGAEVYYIATQVGPDQRDSAITFVGGLLVMTLLISLIKAIATGTLFRWFMKWLHSGKDTKRAG